MQRIAAVLLFLTSSIVWAQAPPISPGPGGLPIRFPDDVRQYLSLTNEQVGQILRLNAQFDVYVGAKAVRQAQVQQEIAVETRKETVDAMALGLRYLELEGIRREIEAEKKKTADAIQALLTAEQKMKAAALREVLAVYPTACTAVALNVIMPPQVVRLARDPVGVPGGGVADGIATVIGGIIGVPATCGAAIPTAVIRTGDFSQQP